MDTPLGQLPPWYAQALDDARAIASAQVYFVVGCQKSGTTWLQLMLNATGVAPCCGEGHYSDVLVPSLKQAFELYNGQAKCNMKAEPREILAAARVFCDSRFAAAIRRVPDRTVIAVGDKTPEGAYGMRLLDQLYPQSKFIHIIRDGRDGCLSGWAHLGRLDQQKKFRSIVEYAEYFAAHHWVPYIQHARNSGAAFGAGRFLEVRYEQLLQDPHRHMAEMMAFLGVQSCESDIARAVDAASFKSLSGGREPGESDDASHFRKGVAGSWIQDLPPSAVKAFEAKAGTMLHALGYPLSHELPEFAVGAGHLA